jgi:adenosylhomocysteine nucleosidase
MPVVRGSGIQIWQGEREDIELVAVCAGMGAAAARRAFAAAEFGGLLDVVLSVGWAGALTAEAKPAECYAVFQIVDAQTGERFTFHSTGDRLVTTTHVVDANEKRRLASSYAALLVDMEAAVIARLAQMRDIPMYCFKAVSDGIDAHLPDINPFLGVDGQLTMTSFLAYVAVRPKYWRPLAQLGRNSSAGAKALADRVSAFLETEYFNDSTRTK